MGWRINAYCERGHAATITLERGEYREYVLSVPPACQRCDEEAKHQVDREERRMRRLMRREIRKLRRELGEL